MKMDAQKVHQWEAVMWDSIYKGNSWKSSIWREKDLEGKEGESKSKNWYDKAMVVEWGFLFIYFLILKYCQWLLSS